MGKEILKNGALELKEFVEWCKDLKIEPVLEFLDLKYNLDLEIKYYEVYKNIGIEKNV